MDSFDLLGVDSDEARLKAEQARDSRNAWIETGAMILGAIAGVFVGKRITKAKKIGGAIGGVVGAGAALTGSVAYLGKKTA